MYGQIKKIPAIKGTVLLTPERVLIISLLLVLMSYSIYAHAVATSEGLVLKAGPPVGGDFVAFWGAARAIFHGMASDIYTMANFESWLLEIGPDRDRFGLTWQYPPTYYFFVLPLAFLPFLLGHFVWSAGTMALFLSACAKAIRLRWMGIFLIFATPVAFNAFITGQNGFLTGGLLIIAAAFPDRRPLLAGIAAGLLTFKPQLGILLPFAYMAAGCWRAFFTAAITAVLLVGASLIAFGPETWIAFFDAVVTVGNGVKESVYPIHKMPTVFAAFTKSGLPPNIAMTLQLFSALAAAALISYVWHKVKDAELRAATLCAAAFLCTPYAYYYEMTLLIFPAAVIVKRAVEHGWRPGEEFGIALLWVIPMFLPGWANYAGAQLGLLVVLAVLTLVLRHVGEELGWTLPSKWRPETG
ncbi:MAG: glycosyltransferase family 87 protein [bacterium]